MSARGPAEAEGLRKQLAEWSRIAAEIRPLLESNSLLTEDLPVADGLTAMCRVGDEALTYANKAPPADWKQHTVAVLKEANAHHAGLLIAIGPAIQKLVDAVP
jgi:hypothetical protein